MKTLKFLVIVAALAPLSSAQTSNNTTFKKALSAIVAPAASGPLPNIGQGAHLLTVMLPTAITDVTGLQVRIEASYNNTLFFPVSEDVTTAKYNGSFAYGVVRANGNFPYIRVRAVAVSSNLPMDAWYTGSLYPIANVSFNTDRFIVTPPGSATATATAEPYNRHVTPPIPGDWVNFDFGSTTTRIDSANGAITLTDKGAAPAEIRAVCTTLPTRPFKARLTVTIPSQYMETDASANVMAFYRDSVSLKAEIFELQTGLGVVRVFNSTIGVSCCNEIVGTYNAFRGHTGIPITFQLSDDGALRRYRFWDGYSETFSFGSGSTYAEPTFASDHFLVPDQICMGLFRGNGNYRSIINFVGYDVVHE